jgi:hypothetical protein
MKGTIQDAYKINVLAIVRHHKKTCEGEECDISLLMILQMAEQCGVKFTEEERREFL